MTFEPPQPPTSPAPAVRPTPPTPPRIDMSPFHKNSSDTDTREVDTPETMARDAVAHGSGALTKRTVDRGSDDTQSAPPKNQTVTVIPPDAPIVPNEQSDYDHGKDVLREFSEMDAQDSKPAKNIPAHSSTEQPSPIAPNLNHYQDGHGVGYWMFVVIFAAVTAVIVVKKFLFTDKPALTKSQLFTDVADERKTSTPARAITSSYKSTATVDKVKPAAQSTKPARATISSDKSKATVDKIKPAAPPPSKPSRSKDDDKGKHFEIRV